MDLSRPRTMNQASLITPHSPLPTSHSSPLPPRRIGLLAGWGRFPLVVADELKSRGYEVIGLGVRDHADPALAERCVAFGWVGVAQVGHAIRFFRRHGLRDVTMAGKVFKSRLFDRWAWLKHVPDLRAFLAFSKYFLGNRQNRRDDALLTTLCNEFARDGLVFAPATDYVPELLVSHTQLTRRAPSAAERLDLEFGWQVAKEIARFDIGQSVVIKGRTAVAVEGLEGTDACIRRGGELCRGGGLVVVKVAKPRQDMRFDVPTIGLGTLETMVAAGATCLAIEAGKTILLDHDPLIEYADRQRLAIVALDPSGQLPTAHDTCPETAS